MSSDERVRTAIEDLIAQGFVVRSGEQSGADLELGLLTPDFVARRGTEVVLLEVKSTADLRAPDELIALSRAVQVRPGWRLRLLLTDVAPTADLPPAPPLDAAEISARIVEASDAAAAHEYALAFIRIWVPLEATLRRLYQAFGWRSEGLGPAALVKGLRLNGFYFEDDEDYRRLQASLRMRNALVHQHRIDEDTDLASEFSYAHEMMALFLQIAHDAANDSPEPHGL
jgi:hypothetical protein